MELIQRNKQKSEALGSGLRHGSRKSLRRRRGVFGLFLAASASMSVIALYQLGILKHVPERDGIGRQSERTTVASHIALAAKAGFDAVVAAKFTLDEWQKHRRLCFWCLLASAPTFASLPLVIFEARSAIRRLT